MGGPEVLMVYPGKTMVFPLHVANMALGTLALYYSNGLAFTLCVYVCVCVCSGDSWGSEEIVRRTPTKKAEFSFGKSQIKS